MKYNAIIFTEITDTVLIYKALGAFKIAHQLRKAGYSCLVVDHFHSWTQEEMSQLLEQTIDHNTFFIGASTTFLQDTDVDHSGHVTYKQFNPNISFCPQGKQFEEFFVNKIKSLNPNCKIVIGGYKTDENCSNKNIDIIVKGYAEKSIITLIENLKNNQPLENNIKNIWGINVIQKLGEDGQYDFAHGGMKWEYTDVVNSKVLPLETARGCIFNCKFCGYAMRGKKTLDYVLDADLMYRELQENYDRYGITDYSLMDDTFNDSEAKLDSILSVINRLNFQPHFWAYARLDLMALKPDRVKKMFDIGVRSVYLGVETLNKKTGEIVGKGLDPELQIKTVQSVRETYGNDFLMHASFIIGLPEESLEQVTKTYEMVLDQTIPFHSVHFKGLTIRDSNTFWSPSEFDRSWKKYGYEIDEENSVVDWENLNWKNQYMNRIVAEQTAQEFNRNLYNDNKSYINNQTAWALMNYPDFSYDQVKHLKNVDLDWYKITQAKNNYIRTYKQKLFEEIQK